MDKLSLFREDPSRLEAGEYRVRRDAPPEVFAVFLRFIECGSVEVVSGTVDFLRGLAAEFGCEALLVECEKFDRRQGLLEFSIAERVFKLEERQCVVERRLLAAEHKVVFLHKRNERLEQDIDRLSRGLLSAESRVSSQSRLFDDETLYRRGCECFFGRTVLGILARN